MMKPGMNYVREVESKLKREFRFKDPSVKGYRCKLYRLESDLDKTSRLEEVKNQIEGFKLPYKVDVTIAGVCKNWVVLVIPYCNDTDVKAY